MNFVLLKVATEICSGHWNIVILLVSWQRAGRAPVLSQCEPEGAMGRRGSPSVSAQQTQCAEIMPIRLGQSRPLAQWNMALSLISYYNLYTSLLSIIRLIDVWDTQYEIFIKLMAPHAAMLDAERAHRAKLCFYTVTGRSWSLVN